MVPERVTKKLKPTKKMRYYSTNNTAPTADFRQATIQGQAPDKGLYFPESIPVLPKEFIKDINNYSKEEIALKVIRPYVGDTIPANELERIVTETIDFNFPLVPVDDDVFGLELFHGPTLAFKDVGARFMSRCLGYFMRNSDKKITVLVATSGDTGGAVAAGFHNVAGVDVVILYPSEKVSSVQELQLTTWGDNITALEVEGSFDDCQQMVKDAFADEELNKKLFLTSANSINVARWLPQQFYYFYAWQQWNDKEHPPVVSVPSGNFGNICAGLLAHRSGLPIKKFIAACNSNDTVTDYLKTETYQPKQAVPTLSNAMDVGNPGNFVRILELFEKNIGSLKSMLTSYSITDGETKKVIADVHSKMGYLLDPHGAVGYLALKKYLKNHREQKGFFLETAHPIKFYDVVESIINQKIELPDSISDLLKKKKKSHKMGASSEELKSLLARLNQ